MSKNKKCAFNLPFMIDRFKMIGNTQTYIKSILTEIPRRNYILSDIIPDPSFLSHIFIGFTQNGKYFLSYIRTNDDGSSNTTLYIWKFRGTEPLLFVSRFIVCTNASYAMNWSIDDETPTPEGVYCYQWPENDNYLLIVIAPEYPDSHIIHVTVIRIDNGGSYIVSPGTLTFSYCGFGIISKFLKDYQKHCNVPLMDDDTIFKPTILMGSKFICAFSAVSEIVCLEIIEHYDERGEFNAKLVSAVLDVESEIFDKGFTKMGCADLCNYINSYELLVYDITYNPYKVLFLADVQFKKRGEKFFHSFLVNWEPKTKVWDVRQYCSSDTTDNCKSHYYLILMDIAKAQKQSFYYSINNVSLTEGQKSLMRLDSPVDAVSISLQRGQSVSLSFNDL